MPVLIFSQYVVGSLVSSLTPYMPAAFPTSFLLNSSYHQVLAYQTDSNNSMLLTLTPYNATHHL
ncbi:MAG: hypothetical protein RML40_08180 [Bacteroidota bacterium]|nr:hypothetical protein [Candidatus Kapabacteria bacterium]MDW8220492.1 hypothetical protein [Bacteroidota bacterium]